ncbi:MAG: PTS glucose transporter subunit IIA [Verrucomicrobia bacterium]|nr:MAG: PTS glucose transporter subunit IIA [Verrucomicrobiota bacterium]
MAIALAGILDERHIALRLKSRRPANTLREIIGLLEKTGSVLQPADFLAQVLARERVNSTLIENGVAFSHARTALVDQIALAVGRSRAGIPWNDKGERARLIFVVAVPQRLVNDYLVLVGTLARLTQDKEQRAALLAAATPAEFIETLRSAASF